VYRRVIVDNGIISTSPLMQVIREFDSQRTDSVVQRKDIEFVPISNKYIGVLVKGSPLPALAITKFATSQICTMINVPPSYINRCPVDLRINNMSYWNAIVDTRSVVRVCKHGDTIIGVMTQHYVPYTYKDFAYDVDAVLSGYNCSLVHPYHLDSHVMDINIKMNDMCVNDNVSMGHLVIGLHGRNSEVGFSSANMVATCMDTRNGTYIPLDAVLMKRGRMSTVHISKEGTLSNRFTNRFKEMMDYVGGNYDRILDVVKQASNHVITVENLRLFMKDNSLRQDLLDSHLGIEVFNNEVPADTKINYRTVIDAVVLAARDIKYPERWNVEKIAGTMLSKFDFGGL
jgi:hypothetical protein